MIKKILNVAFWVIFFVVFSIWVTDFVQTLRQKDPVFCLKKITHQFDDGTVDECMGLGYRIYNYNRTSLKTGVDFAPIFVKMKTK